MELKLRNLRPAKVRNAVRRRAFELLVPRLQMSPAPHRIIELGSSYGGWRLPDQMVGPSWVCYCVGAGGDVSFDLALVDRYGATVRAFDAVESYVRSAEREGDGRAGYSVHHAAIAAADGPVRMQVTHDRGSSSVSAAGLYESHDYIELPGRTLESLMAELGDRRIDLLKLDIEGAEYDVLPSLDLRGLGVTVFSTQLHHTGSVAAARGLIARLREQGYVPVACRSAVKVTFLRADAAEAPAPPPAAKRANRADPP
jgi:FkbM family methyltransferase